MTNIIEKRNRLLAAIAMLCTGVTQACLHDVDIARDKRDLIVNHFKGNVCITPETSFEKTRETFSKCLDSHPWDLDLRVHFAKFLFKTHDTKKGLEEFSFFILKTTSDRYEYAGSFIENLTDENYTGSEIKNLVLRNDQILNDCVTRARQARIRPSLSMNSPKFSKNQREEIYNNLLRLEELLSGFEFCYAAYIKIFFNNLNALALDDDTKTLVKKLYYQKNGIPKPQLDFLFARFCLARDNKFSELLTLCEPLIAGDPDHLNPYQNSETYDLVAHAHYSLSDLCFPKKSSPSPSTRDMTPGISHMKQAGHYTDLALALEDGTPPFLTYLHRSIVHLFLEEYEETLEYLSLLRSLNKQDLTRERVSLIKVNLFYTFALTKLDRHDELCTFFTKKQGKILKKNKKISLLIKNAQAAHAHQQEDDRKREEARQRALHTARAHSATDTTTAQSIEAPDAAFDDHTGHGKDKYVPQKNRTKKKTRKNGNPASRAPDLQDSQSSPPSAASLISIHEITKNKNAVSTFHKLFAKYHNDVRSDSNVTISLTEIDAFFEALGQTFETSNGTSHQKVRLNFEEQGSAIGEQMVILTSKTYLKPEQIKALRLAFIAARIVPDDKDIQAKLREEGLL